LAVKTILASSDTAYQLKSSAFPDSVVGKISGRHLSQDIVALWIFPFNWRNDFIENFPKYLAILDLFLAHVHISRLDQKGIYRLQK